MDSSASAQVSQTWRHALKLRKHLQKQLDKVQANTANLDMTIFEAINTALEQFRLACVSTIFLDFDFAVAEGVENTMWSVHTSINAEYRRTVARLKGASHAVERRKVEKSYHDFLRIAQKFYKGYIQRLAARYDIPELKRAAQGIEVEQLASEDTISPVPSDLNSKVLKTCHSTLIRLGDLARYRVQAKQRKSGYDMAVTCYSLAHDLMPESGFGFHQLGMINIEEENHLDIVYNFYRSLTAPKPHPNAKSNLEAEFRALQDIGASSRRNHHAAPQDALSMWFVKLQALFYKGELSTQHDEVEREVMHRMEMACKDSACSDQLFKMALINMSSYHTASAKMTEDKSSSASRFCHFSLRFNVMFLSLLCRTIESKLSDKLSKGGQSTGASEAHHSPDLVVSLLPVLRVYTMWLAARRSDLTDRSDSMDSVITTMLQTLAKVFTLLCVETYSHREIASCPYLLPEDLIVRGLTPLGDDQVPDVCRYGCQDDGSAKPHLQTPEESLGVQQEKLARILDILRGAYFLAEDANFPMSYRVVDNWLVFETQPLRGSPVTSSQAANANTAQIQTDSYNGQGRPASRPPTAFVRAELQSTPTRPQTAREAKDSADRDRDDADNTVFNMLSPFLKPPTPEEEQPAAKSHRLHDSFSSLGASAASPNGASTEGSAPSRRLEPLPWSWVYNPTPHQGQDPPSPAVAAAFFSPNHSSKDSMAALRQTDDPFVGDPGYEVGPSPQRTNGLASPSMDTVHQNQLLQSFAASNPNSSRVSAFSAWNNGASRPNAQAGPTSSPWAAQGGQAAAQYAATPTFSHSSSIYQGTPNNAANFGYPSMAGYEGLNIQAPAHTQHAHPSGQFHMDDTTSNYDRAIFEAAYTNHK